MNRLLLLLGLSILVPTNSFAAEETPDAIKAQRKLSNDISGEIPISYKELKEQYRQLFLDDWQRLMLAEKYAEAHTRAEQDEDFYLQGYAKQGNYRTNTALFDAKRHEAIQRKVLPVGTVKTEEFYCLEASSIQELINVYETQIKTLKDQQTRTYESIQELITKSKTGPLLKEKYENKALEAEKNIEKWEGFLREDNKSLVRISVALVKNQGKEAELDLSDLTDKECQLLRSNTYEDLVKLQQIIERRMRNNVASNINSYKHQLVSSRELLARVGEARLEEHEASALEDMVASMEAFRESTDQQIELLQKKIVFIQNNPSFFVPLRRSLKTLRGDQEHTIESLKRGEGITVGVVDTFPLDMGWFPFQSKLANPDFKGEPDVLLAGMSVDNDHAIHVTGIIASDQRTSTDEPVGVAPGVLLDFFNVSDVSNVEQSIQSNYYYQFERPMVADRLVKLIDALPSYKGGQPCLIDDQKWTEMCQEFELDKLDPTNRTSIESISSLRLLQSQSRIYNFSMGFSSLDQFGQYSELQLEGNLIMLAALKALTANNKLIVFALGNDGIYTNTSPQDRILKALLKAQSTRGSAISVTNLFQDGLTLVPNSNQPGDDKSLWERTLSAPGFDIESNAFGQEGKIELKKLSGTSMAAPHVSGAGAVVLSNYPNLTSVELASCLLLGATPILINEEGVPYEVTDMDAGMIECSPLYQREHIEQGRKKYGMGRVNIKNALERAKQIISAPIA